MGVSMSMLSRLDVAYPPHDYGTVYKLAWAAEAQVCGCHLLDCRLLASASALGTLPAAKAYKAVQQRHIILG